MRLSTELIINVVREGLVLCIRKRNSSSGRFKDAKTIRRTVSFCLVLPCSWAAEWWNTTGYGTVPARKDGRAHTAKCRLKGLIFSSNFPWLRPCSCCPIIGPILLSCASLCLHDRRSPRVSHWMGAGTPVVVSLPSVLGSVENWDHRTELMAHYRIAFRNREPVPGA